MRIGRALRFLRTRKGVSQQKLAKGILSTSFLSKIENEHNSITFEILVELLNRLGVEIEEFIALANELDQKRTSYSLARLIEDLLADQDRQQPSAPIINALRIVDIPIARIALKVDQIRHSSTSDFLQKPIEDFFVELEYIGHVEALVIEAYYPYSSTFFKKIVLGRLCRIHMATAKTKQFHKDHTCLVSLLKQEKEIKV